jgi:hypothetical protein
MSKKTEAAMAKRQKERIAEREKAAKAAIQAIKPAKSPKAK